MPSPAPRCYTLYLYTLVTRFLGSSLRRAFYLRPQRILVLGYGSLDGLSPRRSSTITRSHSGLPHLAEDL